MILCSLKSTIWRLLCNLLFHYLIIIHLLAKMRTIWLLFMWKAILHLWLLNLSEIFTAFIWELRIIVVIVLKSVMKVLFLRLLAGSLANRKKVVRQRLFLVIMKSLLTLIVIVGPETGTTGICESYPGPTTSSSLFNFILNRSPIVIWTGFLLIFDY